MKKINKGENALIRRNLKKADGTDLLLSDISTLTAEIIQRGTTLETYSYVSPYLREGETTSQVELEISTTLSNTFSTGRVYVKWTIVAVSSIFEEEGIQKDIINDTILDVE